MSLNDCIHIFSSASFRGGKTTVHCLLRCPVYIHILCCLYSHLVRPSLLSLHTKVVLSTTLSLITCSLCRVHTVPVHVT